jgi:hypothetical protein
MTVLLAALLLDVADTPPFTVDEAGMEDETAINPLSVIRFPLSLVQGVQ